MQCMVVSTRPMQRIKCPAPQRKMKRANNTSSMTTLFVARLVTRGYLHKPTNIWMGIEKYEIVMIRSDTFNVMIQYFWWIIIVCVTAWKNCSSCAVLWFESQLHSATLHMEFLWLHRQCMPNHKSQICDCDSQTQMRYGNAPMLTKTMANHLIICSICRSPWANLGSLVPP